ncbi:MAG: retropepsin-like aspartic protease, partial [Pseudomonadota bacterium]
MQTRRALLTAAAFVPLTAALPAFGQKRVFAAKIKLLGPRVTIDVMVNGKGPYPFMIDTGGYLSLMEEGLIAELGLTRIGQIGMRGVGGSQISRLFRASDVIFGGGVRQRDVVFAAMSGGFGAGIRGVLAAGMLTQFDSELDFDRGEWR